MILWKSGNFYTFLRKIMCTLASTHLTFQIFPMQYFAICHKISYKFFFVFWFIFHSIFFCKTLLFAQNVDIFKPRPLLVIRPIIQMDFRQSFVKNSPIRIYGGNIGARIGDLDQITLGYYTLTSSSKQEVITRNRIRLNTENSLNIWYLSLNFTHYIVNNRYWEMGFPLEAGYGKSIEEFKSQQTTNPTTGQIIPSRVLQTYENDIYPIQGGLLVHIKLTKWIGVKGSLGFRHTITPPNVQKPVFTEDFNGLYYSYGVKLYLDNIYNSFSGRNKKTFFFPKAKQ